jgi:hypothetical protein
VPISKKSQKQARLNEYRKVTEKQLQYAVFLRYGGDPQRTKVVMRYW